MQTNDVYRTWTLSTKYLHRVLLKSIYTPLTFYYFTNYNLFYGIIYDKQTHDWTLFELCFVLTYALNLCHSFSKEKQSQAISFGNGLASPLYHKGQIFFCSSSSATVGLLTDDLKESSFSLTWEFEWTPVCLDMFAVVSVLYGGKSVSF